ncbi:MAG: ABC transporter substrate-binding protein [candidate division WOR-3 bacterium]
MLKRALALFFIALFSFAQKPSVSILKVGHVGHDHHSALYVAALAGEEFKDLYGIWLKKVREKELYELYDGESLIAEIELYKSGGGSVMPTMMSQGHFDVGLGGIAAVIFFIDKGAPIKVISPLHAKGDMLVVKPELKINSWEDFVKWVKKQKQQVRIGYKDPVAVAKLIFERALKEEKITFTEDKSNTKAKVLLINMKGEENLVPGLKTGQIEGYISNNPWCALAEEKGVGHCVTPLEDLPPGIFRDHPCCCIAATEKVIKEQGDVLSKFLELMAVATHYINTNRDKAITYVAKWIGTSEVVEKVSMATSAYSMEPNENFFNGIWRWQQEMTNLGNIKEHLKGKDFASFKELVFDFAPLEKALASAAKRIK